MVNTTHQTGWFKTNKTITVIVSIMLAVCPIPSEKGGCVAPSHKRLHPWNVHQWYLPLGNWSILLRGQSQGTVWCQVGLSILLKRKSYWVLQVGKNYGDSRRLLGWPESWFRFFHKMLHVLCMCLQSPDISSLQSWQLITYSISSSGHLLTGRSSELQ